MDGEGRRSHTRGANRVIKIDNCINLVKQQVKQYNKEKERREKMSIEVVCRKYGDNKIFYSREENTGGSVIKFLSEEGLGTLRKQTVIISDDQELGDRIRWGIRYAFVEKEIATYYKGEKREVAEQAKKIASVKKDETFLFVIPNQEETEYKERIQEILNLWEDTLFILAVNKAKWVEDVLKKFEKEYTSKDEDSFSERGNDYAH